MSINTPAYLLITIVIPITLAGVIHLLVIKKNYFASLKVPLDFGQLINGKRLFGDHKTLRGLLVMVGLSAFFYCLTQAILFGKINVFLFLQGSLLGLGYILAELPNSFLKRQKGIPEGRSAQGINHLVHYLVDQIDSVVGATLVAALLFKLRIGEISLLFSVGILVHILVDIIAHKVKWKKRVTPYKRYMLSQIFIWSCCKLIFRYLNTTRVYGLHNLENITYDLPIIITPNHRNRFDSYLIAGALPWKSFVRLMPIRYMTDKKFMNKLLLGCFLRFCGAYTTATKKDKTHYRSKDMLCRGEAIMIFPEGKMNERINTKQKVKVGALWIAREVKQAHFLPVKIDSQFVTPIPKIFLGKQKFKVTFGPIYRPKLFKNDLQDQSNELINTIYSLK